MDHRGGVITPPPRLRGERRVVVEHRREPPLGFLGAPALAPGVVLDLIALDLADAEIVALRVAEIEAAHRGAGPHGEALGERHAGRRSPSSSANSAAFSVWSGCAG